MVVTAPGEDSMATGVNGDQTDNNASASGAAYTYVRNGTVWRFQSYIRASNADPGDNFGASIAISRNIVLVDAPSEDGNSTVINGDQSNNSASAAGAACVLVRTGGAWVQQAYLKALNAESVDTYGFGVAIAGNTAVVTARGEDSSAIGVDGSFSNTGASAAGAAYVYLRKGGIWSHQGYLKASNTDQFDLFGDRVAMTADSIVISATGEDSTSGGGINGIPGNNGVSGSGAAYVFGRSGNQWAQEAFLKASNAGVSDMFGSVLAISPRDIVVGATGEDSSSITINFGQSDNTALESGAAYVYGGVRTSPASELGVFVDGIWYIDRDADYLYNPATETFGWGSPGDIPVRGDWNGDGVDDVGVYSNGLWYIDTNGDGVFNPTVDQHGWGLAGWEPIPGAWE